MSVAYEDDLTILDSDLLYRRIPPYELIWEDSLGVWRPKSSAFEDHPNGTPMSVVLESVLAKMKREPSSIVANFPGYSLVAISAGIVRGLGLGIIRSPLAEEPAHAEIFGKKTRSIRKSLRQGAVWVVPPEAKQIT